MVTCGGCVHVGVGVWAWVWQCTEGECSMCGAMSVDTHTGVFVTIVTLIAY